METAPQLRTEDLVLAVKPADPAVWDDSHYEPFFDALCGTREFQKEALRTTLSFLLGQRYRNLRHLARENYEAREELQRHYSSWAAFENRLQLPEQLACSVDLATGTGKSYVLYGLATVLLAEGVVDRVLVLCPSNTIEAGLIRKFRALSANADLRDTLPANAAVRVPNVMTASATITPDSICIENYHAILEHVKSSVRDSLLGQGGRTLVLCDEAHHVTNSSTTSLKRWKQFLLDPKFEFRMIVGMSGTCYVDDEYFADVVSRYSLRQAMEEGRVKLVDYVVESQAPGGASERWQLVHKHHKSLRRKLRDKGVHPLTIVVTRSIDGCKRVAGELQDFLEEAENISPETAASKVLVVTSAPEHAPNLARLSTVDSVSSKVEWIVSVSMLTEGWDVQNVFQIVPHEERAFNSRLLICQVLGRGLRIPVGWTGAQPEVAVFNHDAWSERIRHLVNEVLDVERRLPSSVVADCSYHFLLHQLDYERVPVITTHPKQGEYQLLDKGYVGLISQAPSEESQTEFEQAVTSRRTQFRARIDHKTYTLEQVAEVVFRRLQMADEESAASGDEATTYAKRYPLERCLEIVRESAKKAGIDQELLTEDNRQRVLAAIGPLSRREVRRVVYTQKPNILVEVDTRARQSDSCSAAELRREMKTAWIGPNAEQHLKPDSREFFREVADEDGMFSGSRVFVADPEVWRTPLNLVISDAMPERKFVRQLCDPRNAQHIRAWIKNTPQGFYKIDYAWKKSEHMRRGEFSPDFFLNLGSLIHVIEIKGDEELADPSPESGKKREYALRHFALLNKWLEEANLPKRYQCNFLVPEDYTTFFELLRQRKLVGYTSRLDLKLSELE